MNQFIEQMPLIRQANKGIPPACAKPSLAAIPGEIGRFTARSMQTDQAASMVDTLHFPMSFYPRGHQSKSINKSLDRTPAIHRLQASSVSKVRMLVAALLATSAEEKPNGHPPKLFHAPRHPHNDWFYSVLLKFVFVPSRDLCRPC